MEFGQIKHNFLILHLRNSSHLESIPLFGYNQLRHVRPSHCHEKGKLFATVLWEEWNSVVKATQS